MKTSAISRGHPLVALLAVVGGWVGGRAATWEAPAPPLMQASAAPAVGQGAGTAFGGQSLPGDYVPGYVQGLLPEVRGAMAPGQMNLGRMEYGRLERGRTPLDRSAMQPVNALTLPHLREEFSGLGSAFPPLPRFYAPEMPGTSAATGATGAPGSPAAPPGRRRWSMDAWALLRRDGAGAFASAGALPASYGASQAGGVLRYRLALGDPRRPTLYLRSTATTGQLQETAAAAGFSMRPLSGVPIVAALEGRVTDYAGQRRVQAAAMAITELPPFALPAGFRGEGYAQGGYVAGRFATPFIDGQMRADRSLVRLGSLDLRLGGGVWGGAQKGAARFDAGPSASLAIPLRRSVNARVAIDWRFRLAGDAIPGSGPALTVAAGF